MERKYRLRAMGYDLDHLIRKSAAAFDMTPNEILQPGKQPRRVKARSVVAYWVVRELSMSGVAVGKKPGIGQSAVSRAVKRGEILAGKRELLLE